MMRRPFLLAVAGLLAALAAWQLGSAAWIHAKAEFAQILLERSWQARQDGAPAGAARPWPWADTAPLARLRVPRLGIDQIVLAGATGSTLAFAPGHLDGTPLPGLPGNAVLSAHRDTHFRFLGDLRPGDEIRIERPDGAVVTYRVAGTEVVDARTARLADAAGRTALTLVTCWPFDAVEPGGPMRYAVFAYAEEAVAPAPSSDQTAPQPGPAASGRKIFQGEGT